MVYVLNTYEQPLIPINRHGKVEYLLENDAEIQLKVHRGQSFKDAIFMGIIQKGGALPPHAWPEGRSLRAVKRR